MAQNQDLRVSPRALTPALTPVLLAGLSFGLADPVEAREGLDLAVTYTADTSATASGGSDAKLRYLDNLELSLDADLDKLAGLRGSVLHVTVLNNRGLRPNDAGGTLQGVNNIEVGRAAVRLYEAWGEQAFGPATLRVGLYDVNSEFNTTESAAVLLSPTFGISSEFASSGPAGPSTFPSSALAARLRTAFNQSGGYAQVVVSNARVQTFGDPGGVDLSFADGLLVAGEVGTGQRLRVSLGGWTFTQARDALISLAPDGSPLREKPAGVYAMAEAKLAEGGKRAVTGFLRGGLARGLTQPFARALQTGLLVTPAIIGRDASAFSVGLHHAGTSGEFRAAQAAAGELAWHTESAVELTYSDEILPHLTLQPDLQIIRQTGEAMPTHTAVQTTLRVQITF
ncbi:carbohydrate porin [Novosphingobium flavum]|uniref:carbohydrate porin n=1 Tax=Novosphingobium aerophilum TaxID=2839843 RepID=UPI0016396006|nr:carbohydrate porin [Novosphingobium aerophilum]MBC2662977.1 carbohydrate porin [Novosphingobium aerophilum]